MKEQDKNELKQKIHEAEKEAESAKKKREIKTTAGFAVAYFLGFWFMEGKPADIREFVRMAVVSIILAFIHFCINEAVFDHLHAKENKDQEFINILKKKLDDNNIH